MLDTSQRVKLILDITTRLEHEPFDTIDLTLSAFGAPTNDFWGGDRRSYLIALLQEAREEVLIGIARHLGIDSTGKKTEAPAPEFWPTSMLRVFASHLSAHQAFVSALRRSLTFYGISVFVAHNDIEPTSEWLAQIELALQTAHACIALLHPGFHASQWTDQEIGMAMGRGTPVFAVHLGEKPYGFIGRFQAFNGVDKSAEQIALELLNSFLKHKITSEHMAESLLHEFETSYSYERSKQLIKHLEQLEAWPPNSAQRIRAAIAKNGQVSSAFGVPDKVEALARKWSSA